MSVFPCRVHKLSGVMPLRVIKNLGLDEHRRGGPPKKRDWRDWTEMWIDVMDKPDFIETTLLYDKTCPLALMYPNITKILYKMTSIGHIKFPC